MAININWQNTQIKYVEQQEDIEELFNLQIRDFLELNGSKGLDFYSVMDKCINILLDFKQAGLIKSCESAHLSRRDNDYLFTFSVSRADDSSALSVSAVLEVAG